MGLTRGSTTAHIARAAVEAIAFQSAALLQAMSVEGGPVAELRVDGGASVNNTLMQFQADLTGVPVVRPASPRPRPSAPPTWPAWALASGAALPELAAHWQVERRFEPQMPRSEAAKRMADWEHAVRQARAR